MNERTPDPEKRDALELADPLDRFKVWIASIAGPSQSAFAREIAAAWEKERARDDRVVLLVGA